VWARPAGAPDPELASRVRSGAEAGGAPIVVGAPGVAVPSAVARAGLDLVERLPLEPGQPAVHWLSPLPEAGSETARQALPAPELDATSGGLSGVRTAEPDAGPARNAVATLQFAGHGDAATAFLAEPDPAVRDLVLLGLLGAGDAVHSALPELHLGLPGPARSDVALAGVLGYARAALRGEPVPAAQLLEAAKGLLVTTKGPLMDALLALAGPASVHRAVLARFAALVFDC
jgi:hypothetical protein